MTRSDDVDWTALASAMTEVVSATGVREAAEAVVGGCGVGLASRTVAIWMSDDIGARPRLLASEGPDVARAMLRPTAKDPMPQLVFGRDDDHRPTCVATLAMAAGATVHLEFVFDRDDYLGPARKGAIEVLCSVIVGALSRSRSSETARRVGLLLQRHLLPELAPVSAGQAAVRYVPAGRGSEVGGDWYDVVQTRDGRTVLVLGDVEGHSVEAAVHMSELRSALHSHLLEGLPASLALARLNDLVIDRTGFATCCCVEISSQGTVITSAGHPPPIRVTAEGHAVTCAVSPGPPLGAVADAAYPGVRCDVKAGDVLVLYSDGLVEHPGGVITDGIERVRRAAANTDLADLEGMASHLLGLVGAPGHLRDDVSILVFRPTMEFIATTDAGDRAACVPTGQLQLDPELVWRLIDASPDALVVADADGQIVLANHRTEELFGHSRSELIGGSVDLLLRDEERPAHAAVRREFLSDQSSPSLRNAVFHAVCQTGETVLVDVSISRVHIHDHDYLIASVRPVDRTVSAAAAAAAARDGDTLDLRSWDLDARPEQQPH